MSKDPRKWIIAMLLTVAFAICFPAVYYRQNPKTKISAQSNLVSLIKQVDSSVVYVEACGYEGYRMWSGSGVVISSDGLILTAGHIVDGAYKFKIMLQDGREFLSEESYLSDVIDIGFIQIDSEKLPFSYLGNSDSLRKGENIFAIGCPFGYDLRFTVTKGIVSGLRRDLDGFFGKKLLLQVDAQIWPGNSGGPIFNMQGQIVGIVVGRKYGYDGIGLCIPSNICKLIMNIYEVEKELEEIE